MSELKQHPDRVLTELSEATQQPFEKMLMLLAAMMEMSRTGSYSVQDLGGAIIRNDVK